MKVIILYDNIFLEIEKAIIKNEIEIQLIPLKEEKIIFIKIYYLFKTKNNPYSDQIIIFYIEIRENYPLIAPRVTCHSNVFLF